jgi:hypothetical protein
MKFTGRKLVVTGIALGMVLSFLLSQPTLFNGFITLTSYFYSFLPESLAQFLRGQTVVTLAFFWGLMFLGMVLWIVRGDFFRAEDSSRRERFRVIDPEPNGNDSDDE